ncbi:hypothetical protein F5883DRAFT_678181 [Diaporthe sp. PMI_573]|nr:hypothetical protein F5883DRAFT_678181 [Diaporthaceae sp. PMI_573]
MPYTHVILKLMAFKNEQSWTFKLIPKTATINAPYHKDQANDKDYSHEGCWFFIQEMASDNVAKHMDSKEVEAFIEDKNASKNKVKKYYSTPNPLNTPNLMNTRHTKSPQL